MCLTLSYRRALRLTQPFNCACPRALLIPRYASNLPYRLGHGVPRLFCGAAVPLRALCRCIVVAALKNKTHKNSLPFFRGSVTIYSTSKIENHKI
ncbi:hypothetical protein HMPREF1147_0942 [Selenomonas sp. FOBRC9]|nr:hypothetical protein HMPREF1147_0942 [Selenomonas sp. FOBRC9]